MQTGQYAANVGSRLKRVKARKAPSEKPAFQPYRGKPAVRNDRGDRGKEQPTRPQSSGVQVPAPPIACLRAVSISDARGRQRTAFCSDVKAPAALQEYSQR